MKKGIKKKVLSLVLCVSMLIPMLTQAMMHYSVSAEDELSLDVSCPFDRSFSFEIDGASVTSSSYRIPAMVTLKDKTVIAAADIRWNTTYDGGGLDTIVARSADGGVTWKYTVANYLGDNGNTYNYNSTCFIDPCLTVAADGQTVYMLCDIYPYGVALNGNGSQTAPSQSVGFNDDGYLLLSNNNHGSYSYYLKDGAIYSNSGSAVSGYTVDGYFNLYYNGQLTSNLFYSDSPYKVVRTGFLYLTSSDDGGASWSEPTLLDLKTSSEQVCLVGPGSGITTSDGMMIFPVYSYNGSTESQRMGFIYSKNGVDWERVQSSASWSSEAAVVELESGDLRFFYRNGTACLCYIDYSWDSSSWGSSVNTGIATNSNTQISAISYSRTSDGKQVILVSCPTGSNRNGSNSSSGSARLNGSIFVFTADSKGTMELKNTIYVNENNVQFMYSCLTERSDGSVAILFEDHENAWGAGSTCYYTMDMKAYSAAELGITLDEKADDDTLPDGPASIVTSGEVTVSSRIVDITELTVYTATAPTGTHIEEAVGYDVYPVLADGSAYTDYARVTIKVPTDWDVSDPSRLFGYVKSGDAITYIPGTYANSSLSFTVPHFSEVGLILATDVDDIDEATIVLEVGSTKENVVVSDSEVLGSEGDFTTANGAVSYTVIHVSTDGTPVAQKLDSLSAGNTIIISDGNGNYLARNGTGITTTTNINEATVWTVGIATSGGTTYYTLSNGNYYLRPRSGTNTYSLNISNTSNNTVRRNWSYNSNTGFSYNGYYLQRNNSSTNGGWTVAQSTPSTYVAAYEKVATVAQQSTKVNFTALNVTDGTTVTIGDTTYTVIVKAKLAETDKFMTKGSSTALDPVGDLGFAAGSYTISYEVTESESEGLVSVSGDGVVTASADATGEATVVASVKNARGAIIGTVTYTVTVSDVVIEDAENVFIPVGGTYEISGLTGSVYTGMYDEDIAAYTYSDGTLNLSGVSEGKTSIVVGSTQFNVYVNNENTQNKDSAKSIYVYVDSIEHCSVYFAINGGTLHRIEGTGVLIDQDYTDGINVMFFAAPEDGYALTQMVLSNSDGQYYSLADGTLADGSDTSAWPFDSSTQSTIPTSNSDSAWVEGHGFRWALLEGNFDIAGLRDMFTRALALGAEGATTFTKNGTDGITTNVSFVAEKLPAFEKTIVKVNGEDYVEGMTLNFGDVVTYQFTVTSTSTKVNYTNIKLTDSAIAYSGTLSDFTDAGTYTKQATYTITQADIAKYTGGKFVNSAVLSYDYASDYANATKTSSATASAECLIDGLLYYSWDASTPAEIVGNTATYTLPASQHIVIGSQATVQAYTGAQTFNVYQDGHNVGYYRFDHWEYNGAEIAAGDAISMTNTDGINIVGVWIYVPTPPYPVSYTWGTFAPTSVTLPEIREYYENESYNVDATFTNGMTVYETVGGTTVGAWTFKGWYDNSELEGSVITPGAAMTMGISGVTYYGLWEYEEYSVNINYAVEGGVGGTVSTDKETLFIQNGVAQGSVATPSANYSFVGWYDADGNLLGQSNTFVPSKSGELWVDGTTYYARFEYELTSLTIKKQGCSSSDLNQSFLFGVVELDANGDEAQGGVKLTVTVHENGSVTIDGLTVGKTYKVTEITQWSWRYTYKGYTTALTNEAVENGAKIILGDGDNEIVFENERSNPYWLDGDSWCNNLFK